MMNPIRAFATQLSVIAALVAFGGAHATTTLQEVLAAASGLSGVVNADIDRRDAQASLERVEGDPLALRIERLQAQHAATLTTAQYNVALFEAYRDLADAYTGVLEAERGVVLAEASRALADRNLTVAQIRRDRGAGTDLDVRDARNDLEDSETSVSAARQGRRLALERLESLVGTVDLPLSPIERIPQRLALPSETEIEQALAASPQLLQATQGAELAAASLDVLDPSYAAQQQIDDAQVGLEQAQEGVREAERALRLQLRSLTDAVERSEDALEVARDALANARDRESLQADQLAAGRIAEIAFEQTQLATLQAENALQTARHDVLLAYLELQAQTGYALEGLNAF